MKISEFYNEWVKVSTSLDESEARNFYLMKRYHHKLSDRLKYQYILLQKKAEWNFKLRHFQANKMKELSDRLEVKLGSDKRSIELPDAALYGYTQKEMDSYG